MTEADVRFACAMLGRTRDALGAVARQAGAGKAGDRTVEAMLRHVAGAEWFYATRLDEHPSRSGLSDFERKDLGALLAEGRALTLACLDRLPGFGTMERTHRGERWTPRKVFRRYIYHELDHIGELEARITSGVR